MIQNCLYELHTFSNTVGAEDKLPSVMLRVIRVENFLPLRITLIVASG